VDNNAHLTGKCQKEADFLSEEFCFLLAPSRYCSNDIIAYLKGHAYNRTFTENLRQHTISFRDSWISRRVLDGNGLT
jgi:hypothetical protein